MPRPAALIAAAAALAFATPALAEIRVSFEDSAPTDIFTISHKGACALGPFTLELDLGGSAGRLYFDTTASGAGVQVYQPFRLVAGAQRVVAISPVGDGDERVQLSFSRFEPGEEVAFTIDVDDRMTAGPLGQTQVAGSEIAGAQIAIGPEATGRFSANAIARIPTPRCAATS